MLDGEEILSFVEIGFQVDISVKSLDQVEKLKVAHQPK